MLVLNQEPWACLRDLSLTRVTMSPLGKSNCMSLGRAPTDIFAWAVKQGYIPIGYSLLHRV